MIKSNSAIEWWKVIYYIRFGAKNARLIFNIILKYMVDHCKPYLDALRLVPQVGVVDTKFWPLHT